MSTVRRLTIKDRPIWDSGRLEASSMVGGGIKPANPVESPTPLLAPVTIVHPLVLDRI